MEMQMEVDKQDVVKWQQDGQDVISKAKELTLALKDSTSLNECAVFLGEIKRRIKAVKDGIAPIKSKTYSAYKEVLALETRLTEPYERAEREIVKPAMGRFQMDLDRKRREEEDRLRQEARNREEEARLAEASRLEKEGEREMADAVLDAPVIVPAIVLPDTTKQEGISYRETWRFRVINPDLVPREFLTLDEKKIGGVVRALKSEAKIPGIEVFSEKTVAARI